MKKASVLLIVLALLISGSASALTVSEFTARYNAEIGEGFHLPLWEQYIQNNTWFLSGADMRDMVIVVFDPSSAEKPADCTITSVALKHKPRVSISVFLNNISAAVAAFYPDIPESERLADIMHCITHGDHLLGYGYSPDGPIAWNPAHMVQFVYQEKSDYYTFLFSPEKPND